MISGKCGGLQAGELLVLRHKADMLICLEPDRIYATSGVCSYSVPYYHSPAFTSSKIHFSVLYLIYLPLDAKPFSPRFDSLNESDHVIVQGSSFCIIIWAIRSCFSIRTVSFPRLTKQIKISPR